MNNGKIFIWLFAGIVYFNRIRIVRKIEEYICDWIYIFEVGSVPDKNRRYNYYFYPLKED